jgi:hypothetical protein|nr:MAG TPA: Replication protein B [Siphoviridae sp. ctELO16]
MNEDIYNIIYQTYIDNINDLKDRISTTDYYEDENNDNTPLKRAADATLNWILYEDHYEEARELYREIKELTDEKAYDKEREYQETIQEDLRETPLDSNESTLHEVDKMLDFYNLLGIDLDNRRYYHHFSAKYGKKFGNANVTLWEAYNKERIKTNVWFCVNEPRIVTEKNRTKRVSGRTITLKPRVTEDRRAEQIQRFNAFYVDIDFRNEDNEHLEDFAVFKQKKALDKALQNLPLKPSAIVDTRNGYHIYYALRDEDKDIDLNEWQATERAVYRYIRDHITPYADAAATDAPRVLRMPCTLHKKEDSAPYFVTVKSLGRRYGLDEIRAAFPETVMRDTSPTECYKPVIATSDVTRAIERLDVSFFDFLPKYNELILSVHDTRTMLKQFDLRAFLQLDVRTGEAFCSVLRVDRHPSCTILERDNNYVYYDHATKKSLDIIGIVQELAGVGYREALDFLAGCYGITIDKHPGIAIEEAAEKNLGAFSRAAIDEATGYAVILIPTYETIINLWKERAAQTGIADIYAVNLQLGAQHLADITGASRATVVNRLRVLERAGIISKVEATDKKHTNTYLVRDISDKIQELTQELERLHRICDGNVFRNIRNAA